MKKQSENGISCRRYLNSKFRILKISGLLILLATLQLTAFSSNQPLDQVLSETLRTTNSTFKVLDKIIVIAPAETLQQKTITGNVTDVSGVPLPGVSVLVKGTITGTITDLSGNFALALPADAQVLVISFMGMKSQEIVIGDALVYNITLEEDLIGLEEVVVVGYASQRRINLTGSLTIVKAEELEKVSMPTIAQGLMGRSPGVFIKNVSNQPGGDKININIRGFGSPLIIVDGSPVSASYFQQLEPSHIESLNILKDASAAAVYGARAGNGVILVTTKRGVESAPKFSYNGNYAMQFFANYPEFTNSEQHARMWNVGMVYFDDKPPLYSDEEIQKFADGSDRENYPNTDWKKECLRDFFPQQQHSLSVRGGTNMVKYFSSINYFNQEGFHIANDVNYDRFSLRTNIDIQLTNKLSAGVDLSATNQSYIGPSMNYERTRELGGYYARITRALPIWKNEVFPDPTKLAAVEGGGTHNPYHMGFIENIGFNKWNRMSIFGKLRFDYELPFGFAVSANFDMNNRYNRDRLRVLEMPEYDYVSETDTYILRRVYSAFNYLTETNDITRNLNQQYFLTWEKDFNGHDFSAIFVHEILSDNYDYIEAFRRDFEFNLNYLFAGADANQYNTGYATEGGRKAFITRINYNYLGKYLFEFSGRADGSPKFPQETRWGYFPSASIGWRISEESFMRDNVPVIRNMKLRVSHGMLGYDAAGSFQYLSTFRIRSQHIVDGALASGIRPDALPNPNITWEKMTISNMGIDFNIGGFLDGSFDYFYRLRTDVLGSRVGGVVDVVGASLPQENINEFDNRGWELALHHMKNTGDFKYIVGGNISLNREKTIFREQSTFATKEAWRRGNLVGEWTDRAFVYPTDGLFQSQDEIDNWADIDGGGNRTIKPGDIRFLDTNGDGRISAEDMLPVARGTLPKIMYGIDLSFTWKAFDLMMLWQGAGLYNYNLRQSNRELTIGRNMTTYMYENMYTPENPWKPTNTTNAKWPRWGNVGIAQHRNNTLQSEFWRQAGDYIRLKNIQLGYTIPKTITNRWGIDAFKVFVSGYNLITIHKYPFIDPEIDTNPAVAFGSSHPVLGTYNFGAQVSF